MTKQDIAKIVLQIQCTYPKAFEKYTSQMTENMVDAWYMVFASEDAAQIVNGLQIYLRSDTKGFPPSPGQIIDCMEQLEPERDMNEMQAWSLVDRAVKNSNYNAAEEFERLPQTIRRVVRNPARLREWAAMDLAEYQTVEQSNFMRAYRAEVARERDNRKVPQPIRPQLEVIEGGLMRLEAPKEHDRGITPDADIEAMIERLKEARS